MKLYTSQSEESSPQTSLVQLVGKLMQIEGIQKVKVAPEDANLQRKSLTGRWPVFEDADGVLVSEGLPIARFLSRDNALFTQGSSAQQTAQINSWVDYIQGSVVPAATRVFDQVNGKMTSDKITFSKSMKELKDSLTALDAHLALRNFLVGHQLTLADALLVSTLARCFEKVLDKKTRDSQLQNLSRYTNLILKMAPFVRVFGAVTFCKDTTQPDYNAEKPKKEQPAAGATPAKQQQKKEGKKGGEAKPKAEPKAAAAAEEEKKQ